MARYSDFQKRISFRCKDKTPEMLEKLSRTLRKSKAEILEQVITEKYEIIKNIIRE